jgi:hypothetical protein
VWADCGQSKGGKTFQEEESRKDGQNHQTISSLTGESFSPARKTFEADFERRGFSVKRIS